MIRGQKSLRAAIKPPRRLALLKAILVAIVLAGSLSLVTTSTPAAADPGTGYSYSQQITIDHTKVSGGSDLTNFPVLVSMTDTFLVSAANGGWVQNSNGYDIIFTDSTQTTKLDHEIEKYVSTTGEVEMWVRIPTLSHTTDTSIYMSFGNSSISSSQENKTGVWDSNYKGAWHLREDPSGSAPQMADSTSNADNGTSNGSMTSGNQVTGQIAGSLTFNGSQWVDMGTGANLNITGQNLTFTGWVKRSATNAIGVLVARGTPGSDGYNVGIGNEQGSSCTTNQISLIKFGLAAMCVGSFPADTSWHFLALVANGTGETAYIDGASSAPTAGNTSSIASSSGHSFRMGEGTDASSLWTGGFDEFRVSDTARSAGWITTEYNNESSPSTFFSVGSPASGQAVTIGIPVVPAFTFTATNQPSACNGESNFISGAGTATGSCQTPIADFSEEFKTSDGHHLLGRGCGVFGLGVAG